MSYYQDTTASKDECSSCGIIIGTFSTKHVCFFCRGIMCNDCKDYRPTRQLAQKICRPCKEDYMLQKIPKSLHRRYSQLENAETQKQFEIEQTKNTSQETVQFMNEIKQQIKEAKEDNQQLRIKSISEQSDFKDRQNKMLIQIETTTQALTSYNEQVVQKQQEIQNQYKEKSKLADQIKNYKVQLQDLAEKLKIEEQCSEEIRNELETSKREFSSRTSSVSQVIEDNKISRESQTMVPLNEQKAEFIKEEKTENDPVNTCCCFKKN